MATGYDLKSGKYDQSLLLTKDIKNAFTYFFENRSKKESSYKYAMLKSILDCMDIASDITYKLTFDTLFCRFSEIYWILVVKHKLPQKSPSLRAPETAAEKIINEVVTKYKIKRTTSFSNLSNTIRYELMERMKKKCSKYVFGALYVETNQILYSFSKEKEWIKLNPQVIEYFNKHYNTIQIKNYEAWARFYSDVIVEGKDPAFYMRLLKRELKNNEVILCANPRLVRKKTVERKKFLLDNSYDITIAKKVRQILKSYPDIGLYLVQICEKINENKDDVKNILENSFWCKKQGSRYYYNDADIDIVRDAIFDKKIEDNWSLDEEEDYEPNMELVELLDDPERLIKKLIFDKNLKPERYDRNKNIIIDDAEVEILGSDKLSPKKWCREEVVVLVTEYFGTKLLSEEEIEESYKSVSDLLRRREEILTGYPVDEKYRNYAGIRMQSMRIRCLDPATKYSGMKGTKLQKEVVKEYLDNPQKLIAKSKQIFLKYKKE